MIQNKQGQFNRADYDITRDELIEMQVRCVMVERVRKHRRALKIGYSLPF